MKELLLSLLFTLAVQCCSAQSIDTLFDEFKGAEGAQYVEMPAYVIALGKAVAGQQSQDINGIKMMDGLKSMRLISFRDCPTSVRNLFAQRSKNVSGFSELSSINRDSTQTRILGKGEGENFSDVAIIVTGDKDTNLIHMTGKFSKEELNKSLDMNK